MNTRVANWYSFPLNYSLKYNMEVLIENGKITMEYECLASLAKGGKPIVLTSVLTERQLKHCYPDIYCHLVLAEISADDWWYGRKDTIEQIVLRQGLFTCGRDRYTGKFYCEPLLEEAVELPGLPGNGVAKAICYTKEAFEHYNSFIWPNGRKACYCTMAE